MDLFDRYFLVMAARMNADMWGAVATISDLGHLAISLGWPLDYGPQFLLVHGP